MNRSVEYITRLFTIRNQYGKQAASEKIRLLQLISRQTVSSKKALQSFYNSLLFILAHPDNKTIQTIAGNKLQQLEAHIRDHERTREKLYNSGITHSSLCAAFSFEMVKWLRKTHPQQIKFSSFEATQDQIKFILSAVMLKVESEILQDANAGWKEWLQQFLGDGEDLLDGFIAVFESSPIRPELKDELWNAIGINVEINVGPHACLQPNLVKNYYHRSLTRKIIKSPDSFHATRSSLNKSEAAQIIDTSRMILIRHLREIDPISFTAPGLVAYYILPRGISIALMGMVRERRHPVDSYMGYMVFKNGLPIAYAGSWILFDSGRIGLNVFPAYRGGESQYIFQQVLLLHSQVYGLKRFSADPYQVGKQNSDGIHSGAFWVYYKAGFRPILEEQQLLARVEALKIKTAPGYRSPILVLKKLADSRLEMIIKKGAVQFDATDLSLAWAGILVKKYHHNRVTAASNTAEKLAAILNIRDWRKEKMNFILMNWSGLLLADEGALHSNKNLQKILKELFALKANGSEEQYILELQRATALRVYLEKLLKDFVN
jgi:hypothetical protein